LYGTGQFAPGDKLIHDSIVGSRFTAVIDAQVQSDGHDAIVPVITGTAHAVGSCVFTVDPDDELVPGFVFR
jgi:proline racemase